MSLKESLIYYNNNWASNITFTCLFLSLFVVVTSLCNKKWSFAYLIICSSFYFHGNNLEQVNFTEYMTYVSNILDYSVQYCILLCEKNLKQLFYITYYMAKSSVKFTIRYDLIWIHRSNVLTISLRVALNICINIVSSVFRCSLGWEFAIIDCCL